jgi:hypothetical protein
MTDVKRKISEETKATLELWNHMILGNRGTHSSEACIKLIKAALDCGFSTATMGGYVTGRRVALMHDILNDQDAIDIIGRALHWGDSFEAALVKLDLED